MNLHSASKILKTPLSLLVVLLLSSGLSCAVAPTSGAESVSKPVRTTRQANAALSAAYSEYSRRDFAAAAASFDALATNEKNTQIAYLGKALVHLSTDPEYRNIDEAGRLLQAAEELGRENIAPSTAMLMDSVSSLVSLEKNNSELSTKVSYAAREIAGLKEDRVALEAEQAALNEALEKLKALTIGN